MDIHVPHHQEDTILVLRVPGGGTDGHADDNAGKVSEAIADRRVGNSIIEGSSGHDDGRTGNDAGRVFEGFADDRAYTGTDEGSDGGADSHSDCSFDTVSSCGAGSCAEPSTDEVSNSFVDGHADDSVDHSVDKASIRYAEGRVNSSITEASDGSVDGHADHSVYCREVSGSFAGSHADSNECVAVSYEKVGDWEIGTPGAAAAAGEAGEQRCRRRQAERATATEAVQGEIGAPGVATAAGEAGEQRCRRRQAERAAAAEAVQLRRSGLQQYDEHHALDQHVRDQRYDAARDKGRPPRQPSPHGGGARACPALWAWRAPAAPLALAEHRRGQGHGDDREYDRHPSSDHEYGNVHDHDDSFEDDGDHGDEVPEGDPPHGYDYECVARLRTDRHQDAAVRSAGHGGEECRHRSTHGLRGAPERSARLALRAPPVPLASTEFQRTVGVQGHQAR